MEDHRSETKRRLGADAAEPRVVLLYFFVLLGGSDRFSLFGGARLRCIKTELKPDLSHAARDPFLRDRTQYEHGVQSPILETRRQALRSRGCTHDADLNMFPSADFAVRSTMSIWVSPCGSTSLRG